jgi:diphthamide biosynthesis protein 2
MEFDLECVISILRVHKFVNVVLQFVDEYLPVAVQVQQTLQRNLPLAHIFITADSTWGSSADDISALHVGADVLVYFGSDLSSRSTIPVVVVPPITTCNLELLQRCIVNELPTVNEHSSILILYEASFFASALRFFVSNPGTHIGRLPPMANLDNWLPVSPLNSSAVVGGLHVDNNILDNPGTRVLYIGDKISQLQSIILRLSGRRIIQFSPKSNTLIEHANGIKLINERFGGVHKVENAKIIGVIVGSMGIESGKTKMMIDRMERLITASGKKFYTFVMGRINEAKLCNFPEVFFSLT